MKSYATPPLFRMNSPHGGRGTKKRRAGLRPLSTGAAESGVRSGLVLPEFFNNEYFPAVSRCAPTWSMRKTEGIVTHSRASGKVGAPAIGVFMCSPLFSKWLVHGLYYDTAMLIGRRLGAILGKYRKVHPGGVAESLETNLLPRRNRRSRFFRIEEWTVGSLYLLRQPVP